MLFFFSSRRRHTICALVTGVQTCALPISLLFLPQRSYLPIGSLRAAIACPAAENKYTDLAITHYLDLCKLPQLKQQLDHADNWSQRLSPGEQQRLEIGRASCRERVCQYV